MSVHRLFRREEWAEQFIQGTVHFSTLETCRAYEGLNGDPDEATRRRTHALPLEPLKRLVDRETAKIGMYMPWDELEDEEIRSVQFLERIEDAYVLCCTTRRDFKALSEKFGRYCVQINNVPGFLEIAGQLLAMHSHISGSMLMGKVTYGRRPLLGNERARGHIGFMKAMSFADEQEFRFLLPAPAETKIQPRTINSLFLKEFVQRVT